MDDRTLSPVAQLLSAAVVALLLLALWTLVAILLTPIPHDDGAASAWTLRLILVGIGGALLGGIVLLVGQSARD